MGSHLSLCRLADLTDGDSRGVSAQVGGEPVELLLVRRGGVVYAYHNHCPHTGAPLDWSPHQFLDIEKRFIQCALHGALFRIETGLCIYGPCVESYLEPAPVRVLGEHVVYLL